MLQKSLCDNQMYPISSYPGKYHRHGITFSMSNLLVPVNNAMKRVSLFNPLYIKEEIGNSDLK